MKKLAGYANMTNPASASNAWAKIMKKIAAQNGDHSASPEAVASPVKATPGKKRGAKGATADGESPSKKIKTPRKTKVKVEPVEEDDGVGAGGDSDAVGEVEDMV